MDIYIINNGNNLFFLCFRFDAVCAKQKTNNTDTAA